MNDLVKNARIESTYLGGWDESVPSETSLATFHLREIRRRRHRGRWVLTSRGVAWIRGVLEALQVPSWEALPGTYCRIRLEHPGGPVVAIGHVIDDSWFEYKVEMRARGGDR